MSELSYTQVSEPIKVGAVFEGSKIKPRWFFYNKRKYNIKEITFSWYDTTKGAKHICFSATDGTNLYEISYNTKFLTWRLEKIYFD